MASTSSPAHGTTRRASSSNNNSSSNTTNTNHNDCIAIFRLGLDEVRGPIQDLSLEQQEMQRSHPFERFGLFWMLTIDRIASSSSSSSPKNNNHDHAAAMDIRVILWNLSISLEGAQQHDRLLADSIKGQLQAVGVADGQERTFDAAKGTVCNLLGQQYPADWIRIKGGAIRFQLSAGRTVSPEAISSLYCPHTMTKDGHCLGGFYLNSWMGIRGIVLKDHVYDSFRDGKSIQVKVGFLGQPPQPCIKQEPPGPCNENPTHVTVFRLGLDEVAGPLMHLPLTEQRRQLGRPFERFGLHWMLSIERTTATSNDFQVSLWALSIALDEPNRADLGEHLKGEIQVGLGSDGQDRRFHASKGQVCNLVGRQYPADWIYMGEGVEFCLSAGRTVSETQQVKPYCSELMETQGICYGGFYTEGWLGMAEILLKNHEYDEFRDGKSIQVKVRFMGRPMGAVKPSRVDGSSWVMKW